MQGSVKFYNDQKGFGFIVPEDGSPELFFHVTQCQEGWEPQEGDTVSYEVGQGRDGRPSASEVTPAEGGAPVAEESFDEDEEEAAEE